MPAAVACKLRVEGRRARIHRTGAKELYDKLGFDGTVRRSSFKLAGCSKVYASRTEMLRELNTVVMRGKPHPAATQWEDPAASLAMATAGGGSAAQARRAAALDIGRLRSQLRGVAELRASTLMVSSSAQAALATFRTRRRGSKWCCCTPS